MQTLITGQGCETEPVESAPGVSTVMTGGRNKAPRGPIEPEDLVGAF